MQSISEIHQRCQAEGRPAISFEFFPPKTEEGEAILMGKTLPELLTIQPDYCSVTYGAGGGTREKTIGMVEQIQRDHHLTTMMHLTCVNSTEAQLGEVLAEARTRGITNILALRGDPPNGGGEWIATAGGFQYSSELVAFIRRLGGFTIGTAGFPEGHIAQAAGPITDWDFLASKIDAGADFVITQLFFDNEDFYRFHDYLLKKLGRPVTIIPGLLPILSGKQTKKFTEMCGARLPSGLLNRLEEIGENDSAVVEYGIEYTTRQSEDLLKFGVPGLHFYTLNKAHSTVEVVRNLGLLR